MQYHPARLANTSGLPRRMEKKAERDTASMMLEVFQHGLEARAGAECVEHDLQALSDVSHTALDLEMSLLDDGLAKAKGSPARVEMAARASQRMASLVDRRITREFW